MGSTPCWILNFEFILEAVEWAWPRVEFQKDESPRWMSSLTTLKSGGAGVWPLNGCRRPPLRQECPTVWHCTTVYIRAVNLLDLTRVMGHRLGTLIQSKGDQNGEWELGCSVGTSRRASLPKVPVGGTSLSHVTSERLKWWHRKRRRLTPLRGAACSVPPSVLGAHGRASLMLRNSVSWG